MKSRIDVVLTAANTANTLRATLESGVGTRVIVEIEGNPENFDFEFEVHQVTTTTASGCTSEGRVVVISLGELSEAEVKHPTIVVSDAASC